MTAFVGTPLGRGANKGTLSYADWARKYEEAQKALKESQVRLPLPPTEPMRS